MNLIRKHIVFASTLAGAVLGSLVIHPFGVIVHDFFHLDADGHLHLVWDDIYTAALNSFGQEHWAPALSYVVLTALIGYYVGRTINAYKTINDQLKVFSGIGANAASIIHDLNNPIAAIGQCVHLLKKGGDETRRTDMYELIEKETAKLSRMVADIKITAQSMNPIKVSKTPEMLKPFLENILFRMALRHEAVINARSKGPVPIDKDYFERALWNVIKNADEALEGIGNGKIEISISDSGNFAVICISDNGPGVPLKNIKHMFDFGETFGKKGGAGIGLFNCKKIVEAHGGKIWITSKINKGTQVYIRIPRAG